MLKNKYGITRIGYESMVAKQDGKCAACKRTPSDSVRGVLCVDHCHETNTIRGLLCHACNIALGKIDDNQDTLFELAVYLQPKFQLELRP
jgi:hypothetical protein